MKCIYVLKVALYSFSIPLGYSDGEIATIADLRISQRSKKSLVNEDSKSFHHHKHY